MQEIGEKCGVFGIFGKNLDVARLTFFGLYSLQHRGQESSGIAVADGKEIKSHKNTGLVSQVFNEEIIKKLGGSMGGKDSAFAAIGHNRYSTSGGVGDYYTQPVISSGNATCFITPTEDKCKEHSISVFKDDKSHETIALAHNGNLPSTTALENFLKEKNIDACRLAVDPCIEDPIKKKDHVCINPSDSVLITEALSYYVKQGLDIEKAIEKVYPLMTGSFSILIMTNKKMIALRDGHGIRPLSIAKLNGGYVFASETCAFYPIGAKFLREVKPGEMVVVDHKGLRSKQVAKGEQKLDIFEFVYFSRPDSEILGKSVYDVRKRFGEELAKEYSSLKADVVIPVPETAIPVAIGFAKVSGIPFELGLIKSRYIHRTFIEPEQHIREQGVKLKLAPLESAIKGKRVIIIDDSLVRGTTSKQITKMLFETGAKEVHFVISSPPVKYPDFYGIDLPNQKDLFAASRSVAEMNKHLGSNSLNFLSYKGMIRATGLPESSFCTSCFTGKYPIDIKEKKKDVSYSSD